MNSRERILAALEGKKTDRIPVMEIGIWPETVERWEKEGLPSGVSPQDYFELDKVEFFTFDGSLQLEGKTIGEDDETKTFIDGNGCTYKAWKNKPGAPLFIESRIKSPLDWEACRINLKPDFSRFEKIDWALIFGTILNESQEERYKRIKQEDAFKVLVPIEPCWYYLGLLGEVEALINMAVDPEFVERIISDYTDFNIGMIKEIFAKGYVFDSIWVFSDLCYKNGMLFSPKFFKDRILPYQKKFFDICKKKGMKIIYHSDGNIKELLPLLIEAGVDCIQPLEARAGNDVVEYSSLYPDKISFIGNINADILASGDKEKIYEEIYNKIKNIKNTNRYIFHSDHSIPPTVSFENYKYAVGLAKEFGAF